MTGGIGDVRNLGGTQTLTPLEETIPLDSQRPSGDQTTPVVTQSPPLAGTFQPVLEPPKLMSLDDMILAATALRNATMDLQATASKEQIRADLTKKTDENKERIKQLEESIAKMSEAKKSGVFGKVFGWIGAIAAVIVAAALIATGVGAVAGGLLIAAAVVGLGMQIFTEAGGMEWVVSKYGADAAKTFGWIMLGIQVALSVASLGVGIASSSASVVSKLPILAVKLGNFVASGSTINTVANAAKVVAGLVQGLSMVGQGAATIDGGIKTKDAEEARAKAKDAEAAMLKLQAMLEEDLKRLKKMLDEMQDGVSVAMQVLSSTAETKNTIIQKSSV
ncbi:MAG: type III secretion system translocon subunit SctE [Pseudomonadota bacterium]